MRAVVGTADVDVLGLLNLAPGDVIVLYQRLDDPIAVWGLDSALRLSAHLGSTEGQVAVQWLPTPR
jgi:flagellar motor switch protein FliM